MHDEKDGIVLLFPENFPDWALTEEERMAKRRLQLVERPVEAAEEDEDHR